MGLQIRTYVGGNQEFIDLYGDETITAEVSFAEIQDVTKKNSAFTQSFKVPGSKNNNAIFDYFYDINSVYLTWNPIKKFEADLIYDGYEIYNGYIRLENVVITGIEKEYNITFYNNIGDVAANIGDKFMRQLDLSHLSHPFEPSVYLESQIDFNLFPLSGNTNYSYQNGKTFWGLYNIGYNYVGSFSGIAFYYGALSTTSLSISSGQKTITTATAVPFIVGDTIRLTNGATNYFIQGVVDEVNGTQIKFTPNLGLGEGTFASWTTSIEVPEGELVNDSLTTPIIDFQSSNIPNFMSFSGTPVRNYYFKPSIQIKELYEQIFLQAGYQVDSQFFNTNYFERYYLPLKFLDTTVYTKGSVIPCFTFSGECLGYPCLATDYDGGTPPEIANQVDQYTCNNVPFSANTTGFTISSAFTGVYIFRVTTTYSMEPDGVSSASFGGAVIFNGNPEFFLNETEPASPAGVYSYTRESIIIRNITGGTVIQLGYDFGTSNLSYLTSYKFEIINGPGVIIGNFDYSKEFPENDFKQIDFITSVNRMFNFVCVAHPYKPNTIIVEPIIDYIGKGEILDWTNKIDFDKPIQLSPTSTILNGTLMYNFRLDQDYPNQQFNIANNRIFGTYELQLNQDYKDNKINFDTIFGSPVDTTLNNNQSPFLTVSNMATIKTFETKSGVSKFQFNPYKILPRIIFRGPVLPNENWSTTADTYTWWAETYEIDRWQETNRFTTYPFSYTGFSHYINWNAADFFDPEESVFPTQQDMYDIYYYDYISDLTSPENKIVNCKAYLTPWEVSQLRFDEKILVKNSYFRINKITNLNLLEPGFCDLELVKLTKDYTPHPVKYFDLVNCGAGSDYHTTSDLNYNMYAYVGKYVNIFTGATTAFTSVGCFEVVEGQPDASFDYEQVFIGSGYTSSGVAVYEDCNCTGTTTFNIIQQNYT